MKPAAALLLMGLIGSAPAVAEPLWLIEHERAGPLLRSSAATSDHLVSFEPGTLTRLPQVLDLAFAEGSVRFKVASTVLREHGALWQGALAEQPEHAVLLTQHAGMLAGTVSLPGAFYEIVPIDVGQSSLQRIEHSLFPCCSGADVP